jgi:hypothetical protein
MRRVLVFVATLFACVGSVAGAQRYRVVVGEAGSSRVSLVEFRPCVPAETSDCGAWLVERFDASADTTRRPGRGAQRVVSRRGAAITIEGESVIVSPPNGARSIRVSGTHGHPIALALAADEAYAFGIFDGAGNTLPELAMIDLNTQSVWAVFPLERRPAGISMAP